MSWGGCLHSHLELSGPCDKDWSSRSISGRGRSALYLGNIPFMLASFRHPREASAVESSARLVDLRHSLKASLPLSAARLACMVT